MKIDSNFNFYKLQKYNTNFQNKNTTSNNINNTHATNLNLQATNYPVFSGGYSIDLKKTYQHLEQEDYPAGIKSEVENCLRTNTDKTLYDIHFEKYKGINDCYSLEELKEKYPEFKDVVSAYSADSSDRSFIGQWKNGNSNLFPPNEDLTLQLIKLYWGQGFSLKDLSNYFKNSSEDEKGLNFHYTLDKLNIPVMTVRYAKVLKLSNKEYNEKFTQTLSQKIKEAKEERQQELEGEPVYVPSKPHSESHRQHISEGLLKYYSENPDTIYKMSERQKEFYEKNPDKKEELSQIMDIAWNSTPEGKTIKKHLSKFFKKEFQNALNRDLINPANFSTEEKNMMQKFWQKNTWAKEQFSTAVKKGWDAIKAFNLITPQNVDGVSAAMIKCLPERIMKRVAKIAQDHGDNIPQSYIGIAYLNKKDLIEENEKAKPIKRKIQKYIDLYLKQNPSEDNKVATALHHSIFRLFCDLNNNSDNLPPEIKNNDETKIELMTFLIFLNEQIPIFNKKDNNFAIKAGTSINTIREFLYTYLNMVLMNHTINTNILSDYFNDVYNKIYNSIDFR